MKTPVCCILLFVLMLGCVSEKSAARKEAEALYNQGVQLILYKQALDESEKSIGKQANELFQQAIVEGHAVEVVDLQEVGQHPCALRREAGFD